MSSRSKKEPAREKPAKPEKPAEPLGAFEALLGGVESFVQTNANFESSTMINSILNTMKTCTDLNQLFIVPLKERIFSFETALVWVLFLKNMPLAVGDEDEAAAPKRFSSGVEFSADSALEAITKVYDKGMQDAVWDHFGDDEDDDEDDEDDEEDE